MWGKGWKKKKRVQLGREVGEEREERGERIREGSLKM